MTGSCAALPLHVRAPLAALRFSSPDRAPLSKLTEPQWDVALSFCDRAQLTLPLALRCRDSLPDGIRSRTDLNLAGNAARWQRVQTTYRELADSFERAGIECVVLKGFSHCPGFVQDPRWRPQYDIDLLLPPDQLAIANNVAQSLGYQPLRRSNGRIDHLPAMVRKTGWQWRGDLYDPEIPLSLELHFRLWDRRTEHFEPPGLDQFWERRERRILEGLPFTALHPVDAMAYACLHLLRHLLRGDGKPFHVYELAFLLHQSRENESFWANWLRWHAPPLRRLQAICFSLAERWFGCTLPSAAREEIERLPSEVDRWMKLCSFSPLMGLERANKDELWLHWNLIESRRGRWSMLCRRLLPASLPGPVDAVHLPDREITWRIALRRKWRYLRHVSSRAGHHLAALPGVILAAVRWFSPRSPAHRSMRLRMPAR